LGSELGPNVGASQELSIVKELFPILAASPERPRIPGQESGRAFFSPLRTSSNVRLNTSPWRNRIASSRLLFPDAFAPTSRVNGASSTCSSAKLLKSTRRIRFSMVPQSLYDLCGQSDPPHGTHAYPSFRNNVRSARVRSIL